MSRKITRRNNNHTDLAIDNIHPLLKRIYAARDIHSVAELDYSLQHLHPYQTLENIDQATALLADKIEQGRRILVVADYDADGATACALAIRGLTAMGARDVQYLVPDRFRHGYGLSPAVVELTLELEPDTIITVDNGISSIEGVALARQHGIDVIITDHHLPGEYLPDASVIVNPNLPGDGFPSKSLAGVGVMFYVLAALRATLRDRNWFGGGGITPPNLARFLDLVALGTVADVVPLDHNNRILVAHGLELIRAGQCIPAIPALLQLAKRDYRRITASDLGFSVGPRLNAAGRLTDMSLGIECLIGDDEEAVFSIAQQLDELNRERRDIQQQMHDQALNEIARVELSEDESLPAGICLFNDNWHAGVIGVLASKIKDRLHRPVVAFASDEDGFLKGSARSVAGLHIRDVIDRVATLQPDIMVTFGGHAMAAGLTLKPGSFQRFAELFNAEVKLHIDRHGMNDELLTDGELVGQDFSLQVAEMLRHAGPWGQGFPEPAFDGVFEIAEKKIVGENHLKLKLRVDGMARTLDAIAFNVSDSSWPDNVRQVKAVYRLDVNEFRGRKTPQMIIEYVCPEVG